MEDYSWTMNNFQTYFDVDEFVDLVSAHLKTTLSRDFGEDRKAHVVDLLASTTTQIDAIFYWMANYPRENNE